MTLISLIISGLGLLLDLGLGLVGLKRKPKRNVDDVARALDIERKSDEADKRVAADKRTPDQRLRDLDGLRD